MIGVPVSAGGAGILRHRPRSGRRPLLVVVTVGGLAVCAATGTGLGLADTARRPAAEPPAAVWQQACDWCRPPATGTPAPPAAGPPTRVRIPRIGLDSSLAVLGLNSSGALVPPESYGQAGWYGGGPAPGDRGPAVIAGHVDSKSGPAVFARIPELRPGDRIEVLRTTGWVRFRVVDSSRYPKDRFPTQDVYAPTPGPELRLVTCGGVFDRRTGHYRDNVVVFAVTEQPEPLIPGSAAG